MNSSLILPEVMDTKYSYDFLEKLKSMEGDIILECKNVKKIGGRCLEIIFSASLTAQHRKINFLMIEPSKEMLEDIRLMGASQLLRDMK